MEYYSAPPKETSYQTLRKHRRTFNAIVKWKKSIQNGCILCDSNYMTSQRGKTIKSEKDQWLQRVDRRGEMHRDSMEHFRAVKMLDPIMMDA